MIELKPCPFCKGIATYSLTATGHESGSAFIRFKISCRKCGAIAPGASGRVCVNIKSSGELNVWGDDRASAAEAWNRRSG